MCFPKNIVKTCHVLIHVVPIPAPSRPPCRTQDQDLHRGNRKPRIAENEPREWRQRNLSRGRAVVASLIVLAVPCKHACESCASLGLLLLHVVGRAHLCGVRRGRHLPAWSRMVCRRRAACCSGWVKGRWREEENGWSERWGRRGCQSLGYAIRKEEEKTRISHSVCHTK